MAEKVVLGMIGCGYWGPNLLRNYAALDQVQLKWVAERSSERRGWLAKNYPNVGIANDGAEVLSDSEVRAVIIATPAANHAELCEAALLAGKDVFVEKPLAMNTADAVRLARLADERQRILMVGHTFLFNGAVRDLKRRMDAGDVGKVHYLYSQRLNLGIVRSDVNASWNLAPHDVSISNYLLGQNPVRVSANGINALQPEAPRLEDVVFLSFTYPNGVVSHVHVSWLDPRKVRTLTVVGDKRMIVYDDVADNKLAIYDRGISRGDPVPEEQPDTFARFKMITRAGDLLIPNIRLPEPLSVECKHFIDCVLTRATPLTDAWSGVAVTAALEAADRSLAQGGAPQEIAIPSRG